MIVDQRDVVAPCLGHTMAVGMPYTVDQCIKACAFRAQYKVPSACSDVLAECGGKEGEEGGGGGEVGGGKGGWVGGGGGGRGRGQGRGEADLRHGRLPSSAGRDDGNASPWVPAACGDTHHLSSKHFANVIKLVTNCYHLDS